MSDLPDRVALEIMSGRVDRGKQRVATLEATAREAQARLDEIAFVIEMVDNRCMAADGPVTPTLREMTQRELSRIYEMATGKRKPDRALLKRGG